MTASLASRVPPMVAPVPLVGWADTGVQGAPSEVMEQSVMAVILLQTVGRMGQPIMLVAPTMVGATLSVMTPPMQVEVAVAVIDGSQSGATVASPKALA